MSRAKKLIEALDDPESFDVKGHLMSPLTRLAQTNGFVRDDRSQSEERWVKKLSDGKEAWLRSAAQFPDDPVEPMDPQRGRTWEFVITAPGSEHQQLARGNEYAMNALLGAVLQRLATWPAHLPKPGQPGSEKLFQ